MHVGFRIYGGEYERGLEVAARLGFTDIEMEWCPEFSGRYQEWAAMRNRSSVQTSATITGYSDMTLADFRQAFQDTQMLGATSFTSHPHALDIEDESQQRQFQDTYGAAVELADSMGLKLALHSCGLGPEQWDLMFRLVPGLCLKYDPSFSAQAGRNYAAEILKYGSRIVHAHAKDEIDLGRTTDYNSGIVRFTYAPPGMGQINWGTVVGLLYEVGYDGQIAIEPHSAYWCADGWERGLVLARRHLEQFIA